ncbi:MAG: hypothetical protein ABUK18_04215, partial [Candidatus Bathyarchaeia archaeon]
GDERAIMRLGGELIKSEEFIARYPLPKNYSISGLFFHTPVRVLFFLFTPTIGMYSKITDIPRILDSLIVYNHSYSWLNLNVFSFPSTWRASAAS